jgi:regulatory subunit for Cdc7p protein kinase
MSSRRGPLTNNPNVANSPLRGASTLAAYAKSKRSYANIQREETYGQPPPLKKQLLDNGSQRAVRSPTRSTRNQVLVQRASTRATTKERSSRTVSTSKNTQDVDVEKEMWKKHHRAKFPKMVFYFESIPDDIRARLTKRVTYLGAVSHNLST